MLELSIADWTFLVQVASTFSMVGLIWLIQIVHYPLMAMVGRDEFHQYELAHTRLITWIVAPLMLAEVATAGLMVWYRSELIAPAPVWTGIALLAVIWIATAMIQVPQHKKLIASFDPATHRRLVTGNWIRTIAWTARGGCVLWMLAHVIG